MREYFSHTLGSYLSNMTLFINLCVLTLHLNMVLYKGKIGIYLKLHVLYRFKCMFRKLFRWTLFPDLFFINRMPSSILSGKIPYRVLFYTKSLFPIAQKIFGCVCFVRDVRPYHTKLDPKSLKCILLGYLCV